MTPASRGHRLAVVALLVVTAAVVVRLALATRGDPEGSTTQVLVLHEEASTSLPSDVSLAGLSAGDHGKVAVWSRTPSTVYLFEQELQLTERWPLPDSIQPLAIGWNGDVLELVTSDPPALYHVTSDGVLRAPFPLALEGNELLKAARTPHGWALLYQTPMGRLELSAFEMPPQEVAGIRELTATLDGALWLTEQHYPFSIRRVASNGNWGPTLHPDEHILDSLRRKRRQTDFSAWRSLPIVVVAEGYVQTIADLANDRRILIAYDRTGTISSTLELAVPLALIGTGRGPPRVYGARRTNLLEVVAYSYAWRDPELN